MILTEIPVPYIPSYEFSEDNQTRTPGLHLSDVLDHIQLHLGTKPESDWDLNTAAVPGFLAERMLTDQLLKVRVDAGKLIRPGEITKDGIIMTPDGFNLDTWSLEEWKCTWRSMNKDIREFHRYWWQIKSYCYALGTREGYLRVLYLNGAYGANLSPEWKWWSYKFTEQELQENWEMVRNHAKELGVTG